MKRRYFHQIWFCIMLSDPSRRRDGHYIKQHYGYFLYTNVTSSHHFMLLFTNYRHILAYKTVHRRIWKYFVSRKKKLFWILTTNYKPKFDFSVKHINCIYYNAKHFLYLVETLTNTLLLHKCNITQWQQSNEGTVSNHTRGDGHYTKWRWALPKFNIPF